MTGFGQRLAMARGRGWGLGGWSLKTVPKLLGVWSCHVRHRSTDGRQKMNSVLDLVGDFEEVRSSLRREWTVNNTNI